MIFCHAHCPSESQSNGYVDLSRQGGRRSLQCCLRQNASSQNHKHPSPNPLYPLSCKDGSCPLLFQFLVKQFFKEKFDFYFTGAYQATKKDQLFYFKMTLESYSDKKQKIPSSWLEAFFQLKDYLASLGERRKVVFIDELPCFDTPRSNFIMLNTE